MDDLFPELLPPVLPAIWPTRGTRADEALQALIAEPQNQADYWHGWRLAAYVGELESLGWVFNRRDIHRPGCRRAIAEYQIDRSVPSVSSALAQRQGGGIDAMLCGWLALGAICLLLLAEKAL